MCDKLSVPLCLDVDGAQVLGGYGEVLGAFEGQVDSALSCLADIEERCAQGLGDPRTPQRWGSGASTAWLTWG